MFKTLREMACKIAFQYLGTPYLWGGDDPIAGFDCSGFILEIFTSLGYSIKDMTAQDLFYSAYGKKIGMDQAEVGDLVFWGNGPYEIKHVEMIIAKLEGTYYTIGASGGGSAIKTLEDAIKKNAYIKIRPIRSKAYNYVAFWKPILPGY